MRAWAVQLFEVFPTQRLSIMKHPCADRQIWLEVWHACHDEALISDFWVSYHVDTRFHVSPVKE